MWLSPRKAKCVSQDPHWAPHPIWVLTFTRFRFTAALLVLSDVCSEHESGLAVSQTHSSSFTLAIPRAHSGCTCNAIHMPPYSQIFPLDRAADCYASVWNGRRKKKRLLCFTNHLSHCRTFLFSFFVLQQMCLNIVLSQRVTLSVLYLKTLSLQRKITWLVKLPVESVHSCLSYTVSKLRKNPRIHRG